MTLSIIMLFPLNLFSAINNKSEHDYTSYLFENGFYREAVPGFLHLYYSSDTKQDKAHYAHMAGKCYLENGDLQEAEYLFKTFLKNDFIVDTLDESFYIDFSRSLYFQKKFHEIPYELENTDCFSKSDLWPAN